MEMQGVAALYSPGEGAVRAVEAGVDVVLMPTDVGACIAAIEAAVKSGRLSEERINASVSRILAAKERAGLFEDRYVKLDQITQRLDATKLDALAESVAERALTLVKDEQQLFPLVPGGAPCLVVLGEGSFPTRGETLARELKAPGTRPEGVPGFFQHAGQPAFGLRSGHCRL